MADLCIHEVARCTICDPTIAPDSPAHSHPFAARFDSTCSGCGFDVKVGDRVRFVADRLVHADHRRCADG
jgi:hypothetical protein